MRCGSEVIWVASSYFELYGVVGYRGTWAGAAPRSRIGRPLAVRSATRTRPVRPSIGSGPVSLESGAPKLTCDRSWPVLTVRFVAKTGGRRALAKRGGFADRAACNQRACQSDVFNGAFLWIFELVDERAGAPSTHLIVRQGDRGQAGKETVANCDLVVETDD